MYRPDTPLAATVGDTLPTSYMQKRAAQQLIRDKNIAARENVLNRNAAAKGMTRDEVRSQQASDKKKPDAVSCDLNVGGANKRGKDKGSCTTGQTAKGQSLKDTK